VDEADLVLAKLAKLDLSSVQHVHDCLMDTTDPDEVARLAHAQARLSRSCRQDLACLTRLKADREKAAREAEKHERWRHDGRPLDRKTDDEIAAETRAAHLEDAMSRVIGHVAGSDTQRHTELAHRFDRELDDWYEEPDFLEQDVTVQLRRACRVLGLPENLAQRAHTLPKPTFHPDPEVRDDEDEAWAEHADAEPKDTAAKPPPLTDTG
jgi:hypothetical protein